MQMKNKICILVDCQSPKNEIETNNLPDDYAEWCSKIANIIEKAKLKAAIHINISE